jgi:protein-S-isoprenylcysteine O-methyltransferase
MLSGFVIPPLLTIHLISECLVVGSKRIGKSVENHDQGSLQIIMLTAFVSFNLSALLMFVFPQAHVALLGQLSTPAIFVFFVGLILRWYGIIRLGRFFTTSVAIAEGHQLISTGLYRFMRHPSYTGLLLMYLAIGIRCENVLSLVMMTLPMCIALRYRMGIEEDALTEAFGNGYTDYMRKTKRLIPFLY